MVATVGIKEKKGGIAEARCRLMDAEGLLATAMDTAEWLEKKGVESGGARSLVKKAACDLVAAANRLSVLTDEL